jgi:hypothetical protein
MSYGNESASTRTDAREQTDLKREYRPIGIGAVAAALSVTSKHDERLERTAANSNERFGKGGSRAA